MLTQYRVAPCLFDSPHALRPVLVRPGRYGDLLCSSLRDHEFRPAVKKLVRWLELCIQEEQEGEVIRGQRWHQDMLYGLVRIAAYRERQNLSLWAKPPFLGVVEMVAALHRALPQGRWGYAIDMQGLHFIGVRGLIQVSLILDDGVSVEDPYLQLPQLPTEEGYTPCLRWKSTEGWDEQRLARHLQRVVTEMHTSLFASLP